MKVLTRISLGVVIVLYSLWACSPEKPESNILPVSLVRILEPGSLHSENLTTEEGELWQFEYTDTITKLNQRLAEQFQGIARFGEDSTDLQRLGKGKSLIYHLVVDGKNVSVDLWAPVEHGSLPPGASIKNTSTKTLVTVVVARK